MEAKASLRILVAVARADGTITPEERRLIDAAAEREGASVALASVGDVDLDAELSKIKSRDARRLTLKAAIAIASVDGLTTPREHAMLQRIHAALGDEAVLELQVIEADAADRMAGIRRELDASSDAFMHAVARAHRGGAVDQGEYEALLARLESEKHAIVDEALAQKVSVAPTPR